MESLATESAERTELPGPILRETDPDDFLPDGLRVTVDTVVVDSVVAASVSTATLAGGVVVDEAVAVSAADCSERAQPAAHTSTAKAAKGASLVIDRFPE
jgi:hypothetical protein